MPILTFDERTLGDLGLLGSLPEAAVTEFARIATDFTLKGARPKMFDKAAGALGIEVSAVQNCVAAIAKVFIDCAKDQVSSKDLRGSLGEADLSEDVLGVLAGTYKASSGELRERARAGASQLPSLQGLDWRLDLEMSRRGAHHTMQPKYLLRVDTATPAAGAGEAAVSSTYLESDYATLKRLQAALADALAESTTVHASRVERYIR